VHEYAFYVPQILLSITFWYDNQCDTVKIIHYNPMIHYKSISILCIPCMAVLQQISISIMCIYKIYIYVCMCLSQLSDGGSLLVETRAVVLINSKIGRIQQTYSSVFEREAFYGLVGYQHRP